MRGAQWKVMWPPTTEIFPWCMDHASAEIISDSYRIAMLPHVLISSYGASFRARAVTQSRCTALTERPHLLGNHETD